MSVLLLRICNIKERNILIDYYANDMDNPNNKELKDEITNKVNEQYSKLKFEDGIDKNSLNIKTLNDKTIELFYFVTTAGYAYIAVVEILSVYLENFSDASIYELFEKIDTTGIKKLVDKNTNKITNVGEQNLKYLIDNYKDSYNNTSNGLIEEDKKDSKIDKINNQINDAKNEMQNNVKNMMNNITDFKDMEKKSVTIVDTSMKFQNDAFKLKNKSRWAFLKSKTFIIVAVVILLLFLFIVIF